MKYDVLNGELRFIVSIAEAYIQNHTDGIQWRT